MADATGTELTSAFRTLDDDAYAKRERRLMPRRRARVFARCATGHDFVNVDKDEATAKCRRCGYYLCELTAWHLDTDDVLEHLAAEDEHAMEDAIGAAAEAGLE